MKRNMSKDPVLLMKHRFSSMNHSATLGLLLYDRHHAGRMMVQSVHEPPEDGALKALFAISPTIASKGTVKYLSDVFPFTTTEPHKDVWPHGEHEEGVAGLRWKKQPSGTLTC